MSEMWKPVSLETLKSWLDAIIEEASDDLNNWERDFIHNISIRVAHKQKISEDQERILEKIYAEKTK